MQFRFLYLDADGVETKVTTVEELAAKIRDGVVGEHTVLYDALTREWGPAGVHGTWRMIRDDLDREEHVTTNPRAGIPPATRLTLAPDFLDDEGSVAAFVAARERERRDEAQRRGSELESPRVMREDSVLEVPAEPLPASDESLSEPPPGRSAPAGAGATASPEDARSPSLAAGKRGEPLPGPTRAPARRRRRILRRGVAAALSAAGLLILWAWAGAGGPADAEAVGAGEAGAGGAPPPVNDERLATVLAEVEGSAFEAMVEALDSLRNVFDVVAPPEEWLGGHYLANASVYPEVPAYWTRYLSYVDELRAQDDEYFRRGYVARLATAGLTGPVSSIRLARAMEDFEATSPAREMVYEAMAEVARAALSLHELLLEREREITWTPVRPGFVTRDPILEAVPDDADLRRALHERLDVLLDQMDVVRGGLPGSGAELGSAALRTLRGTRSSPGGGESPGS